MAEEPKKVESECPSEPPPPQPAPAAVPELADAPKDIAEEKAVVPPQPPPSEEKPEALAIVESNILRHSTFWLPSKILFNFQNYLVGEESENRSRCGAFFQWEFTNLKVDVRS